MEVQPQLVLLQKTLLYIEGLGRQLYPELDLWKTAKPFLERWMNEQLGWRAVVRSVKENAPYWAEKMPEIPNMIYDSLRQYQTQPKQNDRRWEAQLRAQRQASTSTFWTLLSASGLICTTLLWTDSELSAPTIGSGIITVLLAVIAWRSRPKASNGEFN